MRGIKEPLDVADTECFLPQRPMLRISVLANDIVRIESLEIWASADQLIHPRLRRALYGRYISVARTKSFIVLR